VTKGTDIYQQHPQLISVLAGKLTTNTYRSMLVAQIVSKLCEQEREFTRTQGIAQIVKHVCMGIKNYERQSEEGLLAYMQVLQVCTKGSKELTLTVSEIANVVMQIARGHLNNEIKILAASIIVEVSAHHKLSEDITSLFRYLLIQVINILPSNQINGKDLTAKVAQ
jgi:hypothetical protein